MSFKVTILGSASAKPTIPRHPSAQVINIHEQYYLMDAGEGGGYAVEDDLLRICFRQRIRPYCGLLRRHAGGSVGGNGSELTVVFLITGRGDGVPG